MRMFKWNKKLNVSALSFAIAVSTFLPLSLSIENNANAQNYKQGAYKSGVQVQSGVRVRTNVRKNTSIKRSGFNSGIIRDANNPVFQRRVLRDAIKGNRSGVHFGGIQKNKRIPQNNNIRLIQRQIEVNNRNEAIARQRADRRLQGSLRRTQPNGRLLTRQERVEILNGGSLTEDRITVTQGANINSGASACPSRLNCGYRIYSDGTGPRIITPSVGRDSQLPSYDGLNGPKIITLD